MPIPLANQIQLSKKNTLWMWCTLQSDSSAYWNSNKRLSIL